MPNSDDNEEQSPRVNDCVPLFIAKAQAVTLHDKDDMFLQHNCILHDICTPCICKVLQVRCECCFKVQELLNLSIALKVI